MTPACVKNKTSVHPRACGEYSLCRDPGARALGSPPRLRGIPPGRTHATVLLRFTPAPAGNTYTPSLVASVQVGSPPRLRGILAPRPPRPTTTTVHPRACGEYGNRANRRCRTDGSPPRLRGIPADQTRAKLAARFTPAPAGNTLFASFPPFPSPVHPRACGEYAGRCCRMILDLGSPPRLRGIRSGVGCRVSGIRFTPAPAGNT